MPLSPGLVLGAVAVFLILALVLHYWFSSSSRSIYDPRSRYQRRRDRRRY